MKEVGTKYVNELVRNGQSVFVVDACLRSDGEDLSLEEIVKRVALIRCVPSETLYLNLHGEFLALEKGKTFTLVIGPEGEDLEEIEGRDVGPSITHGDRVYLRRIRVKNSVMWYADSLEESETKGELAIHNSVIEGNLELRFSKYDNGPCFRGTTFENDFEIKMCEFRGNVLVEDCTFDGNITVFYSHFDMLFQFIHCTAQNAFRCADCYFGGGVLLSESVLNGRNYEIYHCGIEGDVDIPPAYWKSKWWRRLFRQFARFDTDMDVRETRVDKCRHLPFRRWVEDVNYLRQWRKRHNITYWPWLVSTDCGRSLSLWLIWVLCVVGVFACFFHNQNHGIPADSFWPHIGLSLLYSLATFTSLDIPGLAPQSLGETITVLIERALGYGMLGLLIAILAEKVVRRS